MPPKFAHITNSYFFFIVRYHEGLKFQHSKPKGSFIIMQNIILILSYFNLVYLIFLTVTIY